MMVQNPEALRASRYWEITLVSGRVSAPRMILTKWDGTCCACVRLRLRARAVGASGGVQSVLHYT